MKGFYNQFLKINLSDKIHQIEPVSDAIFEKYLGGKGLATHLLLENNPPGVDPLAPENTLIFTNGPLGGSTLWGSCRYGVYTKSPLTGFFTESYSGGRTPDAMDAAGLNAQLFGSAADTKEIWPLVVEKAVAKFQGSYEAIHGGPATAK